jgi:hypothetical protein
MKLVKEKNGVLGVFVNSTGARQVARLTGQIVALPANRQSGKPLDVRDGRVELALEPFGVEVVRWDMSP